MVKLNKYLKVKVHSHLNDKNVIKTFPYNNQVQSNPLNIIFIITQE